MGTGQGGPCREKRDFTVMLPIRGENREEGETEKQRERERKKDGERERERESDASRAPAYI